MVMMVPPLEIYTSNNLTNGGQHGVFVKLQHPMGLLVSCEL